MSGVILISYQQMHSRIESAAQWIPYGTFKQNFFPFFSEIHPDPYTFKPDRFLDKDGHFKKTNTVLTFSIGKTSLPFISLNIVTWSNSPTAMI